VPPHRVVLHGQRGQHDDLDAALCTHEISVAVGILDNMYEKWVLGRVGFTFG
jgi:hypothetical protein